MQKHGILQFFLFNTKKIIAFFLFLANLYTGSIDYILCNILKCQVWKEAAEIDFS